MKLITFEEIKSLGITPEMSYEWIDYVLRNRDRFILPTKVKIPLDGSDYCNLMPCAMPDEKYFGIKVINRSERRHKQGGLNLDSQILLYNYETSNLEAILDGNYITTIRTATVAVHTIINLAKDFSVLSMLGLGNIGVSIGDILFRLTKDRHYTVKLLRYKNQAERFIERFHEYKNIEFVICNDYDSLMQGSDLVVSSVTYANADFCDPSVYKAGCTIIPVHMRGFMKCDLSFDHIIVSDMVRAKEFKYFNSYKKVSLTDDVLLGKANVREKPDERVLIYNLGLAITDIYFASKIVKIINGKEINDLNPMSPFYI